MGQDIVFINFGWMINYKGQTENDRLYSKFAYVQENGTGHEVLNFKPFRGTVRGYTPRSRKIKIDRLNGNPRNEQAAQDITVVWVSKHPATEQHVIIGWYLEATIYPNLKRYSPSDFEEGIDYQIETEEQNVRLLSVGQRNFQVPTKPNGVGQSPIWYGKEEFNNAVKI